MIRFTMRSLVAALVFAVLSVPPAPAAQGKDYEIKLVRPPKVGQRYTLKSEGALTRDVKYTVAGQDARTVNDGFGVRLEGTVEVLEVNKDGEEHKSACTVT